MIVLGGIEKEKHLYFPLGNCIKEHERNLVMKRLEESGITILAGVGRA
jgi:hypothetical protein